MCSGLGISAVSLAEALCVHPQVQIRFTWFEHHINRLLQNILSYLAFFHRTLFVRFIYVAYGNSSFILVLYNIPL